DLRHTSASWQVQQGVALEVVKENMGHADISTTLRYAHHADTARRDAMEALGAKLGGRGKRRARA
ncbi:MAG: integrase, partial [Betaproteobacteria bacterium]|nr:integrase [Betaproteobacteria bacterium]